MANCYGTTRTNYFTPIDLASFEAQMKLYGIGTWNDKDGMIAIAPSQCSDGFWPSSFQDEAGTEQEFSFQKCIMPLVKEGEVVIVMSVGNEKLRYVVGEASAYHRIGDGVEEVNISLGGIYALAKEAFGKTTTLAEY